MKEDDELEMLLGEIPHAISQNINNISRSNAQNVDDGVTSNWSFVSHGVMYGDDLLSHFKYNTCPSPVSGFSLKSDVSSSSLMSVSSGHSLSDYGSPIPPPLEETKSPMFYTHSRSANESTFGWNVADALNGKKANENLVDDLGLSSDLRRMYISEEPEDNSVDANRFMFSDHYSNGANRMSVERNRGFDNHRKGFSDFSVVKSSVSRGLNGFTCDMNSAMVGLQQDFRLGSSLGSGYIPGLANGLSYQSNCGNHVMSSPHHRTKEPAGYYWQREVPASNLASPIISRSGADGLIWARNNGMNVAEERGTSNPPNTPHLTYTKPHPRVEKIALHYPSMLDGRMVALNNRLPNGGVEGYMEDSLIIPSEGLNYAIKKGRSKVHSNRGSSQEICVGNPQDRRSQLDCRLQFAGTNENGRSVRMHCPFSLPFKINTLAEAQGYIYFMAKDQHGCRFLQRLFDEGTPLDAQIIFNEIIDHVVELMMNPFGNYLMQKLLEVCSEEQRLQILLMVTRQPSELVRISLNTHGTRVVQKLIETLKSKQQISLVISALEPGFLALIKDLNGNHVIQRCLQCFNTEDNKFIFVAAAKYCVDIATHQHGCCVLQRCISHSTEEYREKLIAEISSNGLLLAQDAFGNYVVQYIVEQKFPRATSKLVSQFEGNYVHLSTQKFSSHVVEKCLLVLSEEVRSKIIHELLSASHFDQLLQDPHANYVVQTALRMSEGPLHNSLVDAIESHKATTRNSPYSKRIFSHKLLKK